jgi:voltage-gated potassium channel
MSGWRRLLRMTTAFVLVVVLYFTVPVSLEAGLSGVARVVVSLVVVTALTVLVLWQIRVQVANPDRHLDGLLLALVIGVLGFALAFFVLAQNSPGQVSDLRTRVDALYFTMTTLLTIGYGDVHAVGQTARVLVLVQMVYDVVVIATAAGVVTRTMQRSAKTRAERRSEDQARRTQRKPT